MNLRGARKPLERHKKSFRDIRIEFEGHTRNKEHKAAITEIGFTRKAHEYCTLKARRQINGHKDWFWCSLFFGLEG
jgi:hypothetical protein